MILVRTDKVHSWLVEVDKTQTWLAKELARKMGREEPYTKGYISQIIRNRCKLSIHIIENLLLITNISFERLFSYDGMADRRRFYGEEVWDGNRLLGSKEYKQGLFSRLFSPKKRLKKVLDKKLG